MALYIPQVWADGDPTKPPSAARFAFMEEGIRRASVVIVTALPGTPAHGDEVYYEVESGVLWHCVYDSTIVAANKWVVLGGPTLHAEVDTQEAVGSAGSWVNLATNGPLVTVPLDGDYEVSAVLVARNVAGSVIVGAAFGIAIGDTTPSDQYQISIMAAGNARFSGAVMEHLAGLSASDVVKLRYNGTTTAVNYELRRLCVRPVRVG